VWRNTERDGKSTQRALCGGGLATQPALPKVAPADGFSRA
jgi:hypothetical protein